MSAPREHVRAVAERVGEQVSVPCDDIEQVCDQILTSTDPAVHAALLDALVRAGVLREDVRGHSSYPGGGELAGRRYVTEWEAL